jgi:DNA-binding transcriptional regulator YiaG
MPNIRTVLRDEIVRLSRKEIRAEALSTKKATAQHRHDIATLKGRVANLERQIALLTRKTIAEPQNTVAVRTGKPLRFVAKGLRSQRERLGLSAAEFGRLAGVSAQSIYNWERCAAIPRSEQLARLAALRGLGKREAATQLEGLPVNKGAKRPKS